MDNELRALEVNDTWVITDLPKGKKAIDSKWLYKTKYKPDGSIDRLKARLVILGCRQKYGVDYTETVAPVAKMTTVRALLALAAMNGWITTQIDATNTFLHGNLYEDVYMKFPLGYQGVGQPVACSKKEFKDSASRRVCKLQKSLYGLKQAPC